MFIAGLGTAAPPNIYSQRECWEALQRSDQLNRLNSRSRAILRKVLTGQNGIETRHLALANLEEAFDLSPDALQQRFTENAPRLALQAAEDALEDANLAKEGIDSLLISTCTGYLCPGLTSYVSEALDLRPDALLLDLVGQGCGAALPNLRTAESLIASGRARRVLSICVEVCSAAFYLDDDPGVLISACLFGDGAAAAVLSDRPAPARRIEWASGTTRLLPGERALLRFEQRKGMLRNILSPEVPQVAASQADQLLGAALGESKLSRSDVRRWVMHPGGRDVMQALQETLHLDARDLHWSAGVLREFGNLSSPSVLFVLKAALADSPPEGWWWMSSFGAGFSCHGALLRVNDGGQNGEVC